MNNQDIPGRSSIIKFFTLALLTVAFSFSGQSQSLEGETLFKTKCASCHKVDKKLIGPQLDEALDNWNGDTEAMNVWIRNWQDAVDAGYARAIEIQDYDPSAMTLFPELDDAAIGEIFEYVANGSPGSGGGGGPDTEPEPESGMNWLLISVLALLTILSLILARISKNVERLVAEKEGEILPEPKTLMDRIGSRKLWAGLALASFFLLGYKIYDGAAGLGRTQGYAPEQPIAFSHKLHAGTLQIDCQYCHSTASISKSASIPAVNVCMNCHKGVSEGPTGETKEIAKIYAASGFNPESLAYDLDPAGPIQWTKIHNLPDHVFFSHAQHVGAGKVECQTCHGPVEEMDVLTQHSNLSMGWCISCHRETKVQFTENAYYTEVFQKYHDQIKNNEIDFVTVEQIGGTECQKCHY